MTFSMPENKPVSESDNLCRCAKRDTEKNDCFQNNEQNIKINSETGRIDNKNSLWEQYWPPEGWSMFEEITQQKAIATKKDNETQIVSGALYNVSLHKISKAIVSYTLEIQEWSYDQTGQHKVRTPLLVRFRSCPHAPGNGHKNAYCFESLRLYGDVITPKSQSETNNFSLVAAYLASRIEKGIVPDIRRVLKLYKVI